MPPPLTCMPLHPTLPHYPSPSHHPLNPSTPHHALPPPSATTARETAKLTATPPTTAKPSAAAASYRAATAATSATKLATNTTVHVAPHLTTAFNNEKFSPRMLLVRTHAYAHTCPWPERVGLPTHLASRASVLRPRPLTPHTPSHTLHTSLLSPWTQVRGCSLSTASTHLTYLMLNAHGVPSGTAMGPKPVDRSGMGNHARVGKAARPRRRMGMGMVLSPHAGSMQGQDHRPRARFARLREPSQL